MTFLGSLLLALIVVMLVICMLGVVLGVTSDAGKTSRSEEEAGAPEGALNFRFSNPDASGSKLGVRVHSVPSIRIHVQSSGGG